MFVNSTLEHFVPFKPKIKIYEQNIFNIFFIVILFVCISLVVGVSSPHTTTTTKTQHCIFYIKHSCGQDQNVSHSQLSFHRVPWWKFMHSRKIITGIIMENRLFIVFKGIHFGVLSIQCTQSVPKNCVCKVYSTWKLLKFLLLYYFVHRTISFKPKWVQIYLIHANLNMRSVD